MKSLHPNSWIPKLLSLVAAIAVWYVIRQHLAEPASKHRPPPKPVLTP
jgi:hypothetical protein